MSSLIRVLYRFVLKPILFQFDPESVHLKFVKIGAFLGRHAMTRTLTRWMFRYENDVLRQKVCGIEFANPVGLSAGFDKDADMVRIMPEVGFGFAEIGTVTAEPYAGNPKPRLYRLVKSKALVIYYGLKNLGVKKVLERLRKLRVKGFPVSISVGKTNNAKTAGMEAGIKDYHKCLKACAESGLGDYYTINISCPNTFGGEPFGDPKRLTALLEKFSGLKVKKPVFLKMPINLPWNEFKKLLEIAIKFRVSGVVIGNINKDRKDKAIKDHIPEYMHGGVSGRPTWKLSNELISKTYKTFGKKLVIIGVGGIFSAEDAYEKICRGATLVQLITGMIFVGPQLIGDINRGLVRLMERDGFSNISEAIGSR